tara:strand:+ start:8 stop:421 length:414 start_codon:yes stop_codon:yes gene_type:complete
MKKKEDWQSNFFTFIEENRSTPFKWGEWDCCLFANAGVKAMTGEDLIPKKLKWNDEKSALEAIESYGGTLLKSIKKACREKKIESIDKAFATTGDLVVFEEDSELAGLHDGYSVLAPGTTGVVVKKEAKIMEVFRIV